MELTANLIPEEGLPRQRFHECDHSLVRVAKPQAGEAPGGRRLQVDVADVCGEPGWVSRLAEMGVRIGSRLRVLQAGSPCLLEVGESRLSLRGEMSLQILVRPVALS